MLLLNGLYIFGVSFSRLQDKAADTIESLHKAGMKVWVLTGDKMETAAATCYASKLFRRSTQILELTTKRTEEQSLHDVLFDLSRTVLRQHGTMSRDTFSGWVKSSWSGFHFRKSFSVEFWERSMSSVREGSHVSALKQVS